MIFNATKKAPFFETAVQTDMTDAERLYINDASDVTDMTQLCSPELGASGSEFKVMLKADGVAAARVTCPYSLLADYKFSYTPSSGGATCSGTMNMCADTQEVVVSSVGCGLPLYSSSGTSVCVDVLSVNGTQYVTLYNGATSTSSSTMFTCVGIGSDGKPVSVAPKHCRKNQTPTQFPVSNKGVTLGAKMILTKASEPCPPCPQPAAPFRGSVTIATEGSLTMATYTCDQNATAVGGVTRICQALGSWTGAAPLCSCPPLSGLTNGVVTVDDAYVTAKNECDDGYTLYGDVTRSCDSATYTWVGAEPQCVARGTSTATSGSNNLLPAVIVLAILMTAFAAGLAIALWYIFTLKKNTPHQIPKPPLKAGSENNEDKDDEGTPRMRIFGLNNFLFQSSRPPVEHRQHMLTTGGEPQLPGTSTRAPIGHQTNGGLFKLRTSNSDVSTRQLQLDLIRETTESSIFPDRPAPWASKPAEDWLDSSLESGTFRYVKNRQLPALSKDKEKRSESFVGERRRKKDSVGKKIRRQNSIDTTEDGKTPDEMELADEISKTVVMNTSFKQTTSGKIARASSLKHQLQIPLKDMNGTPRSGPMSSVQ
ncbi:hypothetical protein DPMN_116792 [Dreissena polymorpha]|uniref:Sushi domain-containing protein n=1 Tax=Dreissena polymorpha TaxID=45954 RepID=A0A9D4KPG0_DREPO|nr:hypothetical protein DPMN_116792 [Dreissena polymorpha]